MQDFLTTYRENRHKKTEKTHIRSKLRRPRGPIYVAACRPAGRPAHGRYCSASKKKSTRPMKKERREKALCRERKHCNSAVERTKEKIGLTVERAKKRPPSCLRARATMDAAKGLSSSRDEPMANQLPLKWYVAKPVRSSRTHLKAAFRKAFIANLAQDEILRLQRMPLSSRFAFSR